MGEATLESSGAFLGSREGLICGAYFHAMHEFIGAHMGNEIGSVVDHVVCGRRG
jgi:hypothetical protein